MSEDFKVGDRVRIVQTRDNPARNRAAVGKVGVITHVVRTGSWTTYLVDVDGDVYPAAAVEAAPEREQRELHPSERALYAAENHSWRDDSSELDRRRLQAAEFAHRTLGTDALLEDVIGLADWILDNPDASPKDVKQHITFNPGGVLPSAHNAETIESMRESLSRSRFFSTTNATDPIPLPEPTPTRVPDDLRIKDTEGDAVNFRFNSGRPDTVAFIVGAPAGTYLSADDADRIIAFLQDAKAAKA